MCELRDMLKRVKLDKLMSYLVYDADSNKETIENYEKTICKSYERIFSELERLYQDVDRQDENLFDTVSEFAIVHDDIYFETGVLAGFQLYKSMEEGYRNHTESKDMQKLIESLQTIKRNLSSEKESIMEVLYDSRLSTALEESLKNDTKYQCASKEVDKKVVEIEQIGLNRKQWEVVDNALSACNGRCLEYGRVLYAQGFKDAVHFLKEVFN